MSYMFSLTIKIQKSFKNLVVLITKKQPIKNTLAAKVFIKIATKIYMILARIMNK